MPNDAWCLVTGVGTLGWIAAALARQALGHLATGGLLMASFAVRADALEAGPRTIDVKLAGVAVSIPISAKLDVRTEGDKLLVAVSAVGDLGDVQGKALVIARALPLPRDDCGKDGLNVVVDRADAASMGPSGSTIVVSAHGGATVWVCQRSLGLKTKVASDSVDITFAASVELVGPTELRLKLAGTPRVTTGSRITGAAASLLVGDLGGRLATALNAAFQGTDVKAALPSLPGLGASVDRAEFAPVGGSLGVRIDARGTATGATLDALYDRVRGTR